MCDIFEYHWNKYKRTLYLNVILSIIILVIQIMIISSIVRLEYQVNAIELAIKKITGYNLFLRFKKQLISSSAIYAVAIVLSVIISNITNYGSPIMIICAVFGAYIMDIADFIILIRNQEKNNISRILKGGVL